MSASPSSLAFTGEMTDDPTGLIYLRARYYHPASGTFLTQDPVMGVVGGPASTFNPYLYVRGNPVNLTDPSGEFAGLFGPFAGLFLYGMLSDIQNQAHNGSNICIDHAIGEGLNTLLGFAEGLATFLTGFVDLAGLVSSAFGGPKWTSAGFHKDAARFFGLEKQYIALQSSAGYQFGRGVGSTTAMLLGLVSAAGSIPKLAAFMDDAAKAGVGLIDNLFMGGGGSGLALASGGVQSATALSTAAAALSGIPWGSLAGVGSGLSATTAYFADKGNVNPGSPRTPAEIRKSIRQAEMNIEEHTQKIQKYLQNPDANDNLGFLANAGDDAALRQKIIDGRIKHLNREIETWRREITRLQDELKGLP